MATVGAKFVVVTGRAESDMGVAAFQAKLQAEIDAQELAGFEVYESQVHHHSVAGISEVLGYLTFVPQGSINPNPSIGAWGYMADSGTAPATVTISGSKRIIGIRIRADSPTTFTIDGGDVIELKRNELWTDNPGGVLVDPEIEFLTGTWQYTIEYVV